MARTAQLHARHSVVDQLEVDHGLSQLIPHVTTGILDHGYWAFKAGVR